jgi:hypothetical protein
VVAVVRSSHGRAPTSRTAGWRQRGADSSQPKQPRHTARAVNHFPGVGGDRQRTKPEPLAHHGRNTEGNAIQRDRPGVAALGARTQR